MTRKTGVLPDSMIRSMVDAGHILGARGKLINPASIDLSISEEGYRVRGVFQPLPGESVKDMLDAVHARPHDPGVVLEKGVTYLFRLEQKMELPGGVYGYCNPKSTTGRNNIHARVLADGVPRYDAITPAGCKAELWVAIQPHSFPVIIPAGIAVAQGRFFNMDTRLSETELSIEMDSQGMLFRLNGEPLQYGDLKMSDKDGSILLTADLSQDVIGFRSRGGMDVLDLSLGKESHDWREFFEPVSLHDGYLFLERGVFYILSTRQAVRVPPHFSCEMVAMDERSGEFRSHYAGLYRSWVGMG